MRKVLLVVFVLAALPRLYLAVLQYHRFIPMSEPEEGYYEIAATVLSHKAYGTGVPNVSPQAWRGPLYPTFAALAMAGQRRPEPGRVRVALALVGGAAAACAFALGAALVSPAAGVLAALAVGLEPASLLGALDIHHFYGAVLLFLGAACAWWAGSPTPRRSLWLGFLIGAALCVRGAHYGLPLLLAGAAVAWSLPRRVPLMLLLGTGLALAPMAVRNAARFGLYSPLPDVHGGAVALLCVAAGEESLYSCTVQRAVELAEKLEPGFSRIHPDDTALHSGLLKLAKKTIMNDPAPFVRRALKRLGKLWLSLALPLALTLLALFLRPSRPMQAAALAALSFSGYAVAGGAPEHQAAFWPLLLTLSGCGVGAILRGKPDARFAGALRWGGLGLSALYAVFLLVLLLETFPPKPDEDLALSALARSTAGYRDARAGRAFLARGQASSGERRAAAGDCAAAVPLLTIGLKAMPENAVNYIPALAACGVESCASGDCPPALQSAQLRAKAQLLAGDGRWAEAQQALKRASALVPGDKKLAEAELTARRRRLLDDLSKKPSLAVAGGLLALAGGNPSVERLAYLARARIHEKAGRLREAEADLRSAGGGVELSVLLERTGRHKEALGALRASIALRGRADAASVSFLWVLSGGKEGSFDAAACDSTLPLDRSRLPLTFFDRCLEERPSDPALWKDRGVARFMAGDKKGAESDLRKALALAPRDKEIKLSLEALK